MMGTGDERARTMATAPSSQAIDPLAKDVGRRSSLSRRVDAVLIGWFFGWPILVFSCAHFIKHPHWLYIYPFVPGALVWLFSCYVIYDLLFRMAEARWPAATTIRRIVSSLIRMLLGHHHHSP